MNTYQPWKEAASLILVAKSSLTNRVGSDLVKDAISANVITEQSRDLEQQQLQQFASSTEFATVERKKRLLNTANSIDYRIMMVKRSALSSFMASAYVFPGGQVEMADFSPRWYEVFQAAQVNREQLDEFTKRVGGPRPPMMTSSNCVTLSNARASLGKKQNFLHPDIAMRIAAIRETFEETGVLLLTTDKARKSQDLTVVQQLAANEDLSTWREKVRNDADCFIDLCLTTSVCPNLWILYEWWDWLTPISVGHKRFDTMFYVCCVDSVPKVVLDNREVTTLKWVSPIEMLEEHTQERVFLAPPQVYELSRLFHQRDFEMLKSYLPEREKLGCERWLPVIGTYEDGAISLLPGDELYPESPDFIGKKPVPDFPKRLADMRKNNSRLNRIELTGPICVAVCNQQLTCGHRTPIPYVKGYEQFTLDSKL